MLEEKSLLEDKVVDCSKTIIHCLLFGMSSIEKKDLPSEFIKRLHEELEFLKTLIDAEKYVAFVQEILDVDSKEMDEINREAHSRNFLTLIK